MNDSIWATVLGIVKTFNCTPDYALNEISFSNAIIYSRAIPMPGDEKETDNKPIYDESKDACNPDNFKDEVFDKDEIIVSVK